MNTKENFHDALSTEEYDRLVALFGEQTYKDTRWVTIGAGAVELTFFAPRKTIEAILDADLNPVSA